MLYSNCEITIFPDGTQSLDELPKRLEFASYQTHIVREGETLFSILGRTLKSHDLWSEIANLNGIVNPFDIAPGTTLILPRYGQ